MTRQAIAVIGAGHAGLSAATSAAAFGLEVLLFEQFAVAGDLPPSIRLFDQTPVWGLFPEWTIAATRNVEPVVEQAEAVLLATGSHDRAVPFAGGSQPGVITAGALHRLVTFHRLLPGQRFVVIGSAEDAEAAIDCIEAAGGEIVLQLSEMDAQVMTAYGPHGIERVELNGRSVEADIVVTAVGRIPNIGLAAMAEGKLCFDQSTSAWVVWRDSTLESSAKGIWVAGDVAGCSDAATAEAEGRYAAARAARLLGALDDAELEQEQARYESGVSERRRLPQPEQPSIRQPWTPELMP